MIYTQIKEYIDNIDGPNDFIFMAEETENLYFNKDKIEVQSLNYQYTAVYQLEFYRGLHEFVGCIIVFTKKEYFLYKLYRTNTAKEPFLLDQTKFRSGDKLKSLSRLC